MNGVVQDSALGRQAKLYVCLLSIESKVDAFKSATPPYQVSEELKACLPSSELINHLLYYLG